MRQGRIDMAIKMTSCEWCCARDAYIHSYIMDMVEAKDGPIYMVNASGDWEEL